MKYYMTFFLIQIRLTYVITKLNQGPRKYVYIILLIFKCLFFKGFMYLYLIILKDNLFPCSEYRLVNVVLIHRVNEVLERHFKTARTGRCYNLVEGHALRVREVLISIPPPATSFLQLLEWDVKPSPCCVSMIPIRYGL